MRFIEGELQEFDYGLIDGDEGLDDSGLRDRDREEKYFQEQGEEQERDPSTNTGIQDF